MKSFSLVVIMYVVKTVNGRLCVLFFLQVGNACFELIERIAQSKVYNFLSFSFNFLVLGLTFAIYS